MSATQNAHTQPLISFVVTTYNLSADLIRECLESIISLSLGEDEREIILIDDGSESCVLDELGDLRGKLVYLRQSNAGPSAARNAGIRLAQGRYIQFVDGDDYLLRAAYEHCLEIVRQQDPDMVLFRDADEEGKEAPFAFDGPVSGVRYMRSNNLHSAVWGYIFRRSILGSLRFTPGIIHEDEEFTPLLMLRAEKVYITNLQAYFYRHREGSIMTDKTPSHVAKRLEDMFGVVVRLQKTAQSGSEIDRFTLQRRIAQLSMDYLYNVIRLTHSHRQLMEAIRRLHAKGLYPLPDKPYTKAYAAFRRMVSNPIGRWALMALIKKT